jgi:hypothetical protein
MSYFPAAMNQAISAGAIREFNVELHPGAYDVMSVMLAESVDSIYNKGTARIAYLTGFSRTKVFLCLAALEEDGLIRRFARQEGRVVYVVARSGMGV